MNATQEFSALCLTINNPFNPMLGREEQTISAPCVIGDLAPTTNRPFLMMLNGEAVVRANWCQPVKSGDSVAVVMLPQGNNDGGSDVLRVVLMIVVMVVAWYVGAPVASGGLGYGGLASAAVSAAMEPATNVFLPGPRLATPSN